MYSFNSTRPKGHGAVIICIRGYFPPFLLNFSLLLFFFAFFRHLNRKKFKVYGHLENALLKQTSKTIASLWVYKFDRVMVEPCEFNSQ